MSIRIEKKDNLSMFNIDGELTIYTAAKYKTQLLNCLADCQELELNLSEVGEMDTAGLQIVMVLKREADISGKQLRLLNHSRAVYEILVLLNMQGHFCDPVVIPSDWRVQ